MKTIKTKLFLIFMLLMALLILSGILLNSLFLEHYYIYKNKAILINTSQTIKDQYISNSNIENSYDSIDTISLSYGIDTLIVDENYNIEYNSFDLKRMHMKKFIDKPTYQAISNFKNGLSQNTVLYVRENESKNKLVCVTNIDNSKYLILTKNVKTIEDSVQIANEFYLIAGLIVFSAGSLFILFFSKKITKPIVEMSNVAENISNLEFDKIVHVNSQDEIGALGESINKISYKLNKSINELKRDVDRRKCFLRNISHELKTPINLISSVLQLNKIYLKENKVDLLDKNRKIIIQNCLRLIRTINNFIDSNKISEGYVIPDKKIYNIVEIIENTAIACNRYIKRAENTLVFDSQQEEIYVSCDKDFITRIVLNLLSNSVKYGKKGGLIKINLALEDDKVCIKIKNDGPKIEKDIMPHIFDRFTKLNKAFNRIKEGSGLGLFMTKALVEIQGGSIGLISNNEGNEFVITMNYLDNVEKEQIQYENFEMNSIDEKVDIEFSDIYIT